MHHVDVHRVMILGTLMDTPGLKIERALSVFWLSDAPEGHA